MKSYLIIIAVIFFSSCLKQSIPDAMLGKHSSLGGTTATLNYNINGNAVNIKVENADQQNSNLTAFPYTLGCSKLAGFYNLEGLSSSGYFYFTFNTDSLMTGNYKYTSAYGDMSFTIYNDTFEYVHAPTDSISFNITSYTNGHISGNFSGTLTPLIVAGNPDNIYGTPGSVLITDGTFKNVPVFY